MKISRLKKCTSNSALQRKSATLQRQRFRQDNKRIQKLLSSEYCDFKQPILIESSFAETTRSGIGLRQVSLALTKTNLILAADILPKNNRNYLCPKKVDPSIESFELVSVLPLKYVILSVFHRRKRRTLKARFVISGKVKYYELSEPKNNVTWFNWCERVTNILSQKASRSSLSETSAGSSSSLSTVYLFSTDAKNAKDRSHRVRRIYRQVSTNHDSNQISFWLDKDIYMGGDHKELQDGHYRPLPTKLTESGQTTDIRYGHNHETLLEDGRKKSNDSDILESQLEIPRMLNRFGSGIDEKCQMKLYLKPIYEKKKKFEDDNVTTNFYTLLEDGVTIWERRSKNHSKDCYRRHYALAPLPHFLNAFGPWPIHLNERQSVQLKRAFSTVDLCRHSTDSEMILPLSRRQLTTCVSSNNLESKKNCNLVAAANKGRVILFWTPDYWYRPKAAITAYKELRRHLSLLQKYHLEKEKSSQLNKLFFRRKKDSSIEGNIERKSEDRSFSIRKIFSSSSSCKSKERKNQKKVESANGISQLRKLLKLNIKITAWDLDSDTLSQQVTLIERDLFLRIPPVEVEALVYERSSKNTPNFGAWLAFSHRISCLVATEVISTKRLDLRARIISRFIITADKCHFMRNFQSCRSILAGLQSPGVYRLRYTWMCVRKYYSTKYKIMEKLCNVFQRPWNRSWDTCDPPYIPYMGYMVMKILNMNERYDSHQQSKHSNIHNSRSNSIKRNEMRFGKPSLLRGMFSRLKSIGQKLTKSEWSEEDKILVVSCICKWRIYVLEVKNARRNIDDSRKVLVETISSWLKNCQVQAQGYNFPGYSLAWEYLLKARYKEEKENFYNSIRFEPLFRY